MKDILIDCGFKVTAEKAHATEYAYGNTIIYTVPAKRLNVVVSPEDYLFVNDMEISKYHNTALTAFPKVWLSIWNWAMAQFQISIYTKRKKQWKKWDSLWISNKIW